MLPFLNSPSGGIQETVNEVGEISRTANWVGGVSDSISKERVETITLLSSAFWLNYVALHTVQKLYAIYNGSGHMHCKLPMAEVLGLYIRGIHRVIMIYILHILWWLCNHRNLSIASWSDAKGTFGQNGIILASVFRQKVCLLCTHRTI